MPSGLPWEMRSGGPGSGIWKTTDGGDHWTKLTKGLPTDEMGKIGWPCRRRIRSAIWANIEAKDGGVYRSDDGGQSWTRTSSARITRARSWYYTQVTADPQDPDTVYVINAPLLRSIDGGATFHPVSQAHGDNHSLWINPHDDRNMINGNDGGAAITFDGGKTWSTENNQPTAQFYRVSADQRFPYLPVRRPAGQLDRGHREPELRWRHRPSELVHVRRLRECVGRVRSEGSALHLRELLPGAARRLRPRHADQPQHHAEPGGGARRPVERAEVPLQLERPGGRLAGEPEGDLLRRQRGVQNGGRWTDLDRDQPGSDPQRQEDTGRRRRSDHQRGGRRRGLQHDPLYRAIAARREHALGRHRRRARAAHARWRQDLVERDAARDPERADQRHRRVAAAGGYGLRRRHRLQVGR